jgi:hypothetical protein
MTVVLELFLFTSKNVTNIWAGIGAGRWGVSETSPTDMEARITKSKRMRVGSHITAALNITGTTVFVPSTITQEDWELILKELAV